MAEIQKVNEEIVKLKESQLLTQQGVDRLEAQLDSDRHDFQDVRIQLDTLKSETKQTRDEVAAITTKVKNGMLDATQPVTDEVAKMRKVIDKKKTIPFKLKWRVDWLKIFGLKQEVSKT